MSESQAVRIAVELQRLGISHVGIVDLLANYPYDVIERQLKFLPYRKAKRKEAFLIDAVRNNYSPPKEFYYASPETPPSAPVSQLDQDAEPCAGQTAAYPEGYGIEDSPSDPPADQWLESGGGDFDLVLPDPSGQDGPAE